MIRTSVSTSSDLGEQIMRRMTNKRSCRREVEVMSRPFTGQAKSARSMHSGRSVQLEILIASALWLCLLEGAVAQFAEDGAGVDTVIFGDESEWITWTEWSSWSLCDATCGGTGTQKRYKRCKKHFDSEKCTGREIFESKPCQQSYCIEESMACETYGTIVDGSGIALSGVEVALEDKGKVGWPLAVTNENGYFSVDGICAESLPGRLMARKNNYVTMPIVLRVNETGHSLALMKLLREVKPTIYQHPQNKVRLAGQSVKFCCKARGNHKDHIYLWYHNGTLIDPSAYIRNPGTLELRNLRLDNAGSYRCKVRSQVSFKYAVQASETAHLIIAVSEASICSQQPLKKMIPVPSECGADKRTEQKSRKLYFNAGSCSNSACPVSQDGEGCSEFVSAVSCCGAIERNEVILNCSDFSLPVQQVIKCGCRDCVAHVSKIRGRVFAADSEDPMQYGYVTRAGQRVAVTGYDGSFSVDVPRGSKNVILHFEDRFGKLMSTTKSLASRKSGGVAYYDIKMKRKAPMMSLDSQKRSVMDLNDADGQPPIAKVLTAPGSFYHKDGSSYKGKVKASVTFIDPRNSSFEESPTPLSFIDNDGESSPLQTFGMFEMDFRDNDLNELDIGKAKVILDQTQFASPSYAGKIKLWSLNPENGMWEEEEEFKEMNIEDEELKPGPKRRKREAQTFLVGNLELRERRLYNLDVPVENQCWMKVRAYRSPDFDPEEQVAGVDVTVINMDPMAGFQGNPEAWGQFYSDLTTKDGICLRVLCHSDALNAYKATVVAKLDGSEELEAVSSRFPVDPEIVGISKDILKTLDYRRSDHSIVTGKRTSFQTNLPKPKPDSHLVGPFYPAANYTACAEAPVTHNHFRFYRTEDFLYEYNTVYMDEHNCITWTPNYLNWWPSYELYTACYIKVHISSFSPTVVRTKSFGGTHPETIGKLYGIRDDRSVFDKSNDETFTTSSAACVEFKCSGLLFDEGLADRTLVSVVPQGECTLHRLNGKLSQYLTEHPPAVEGESSSEFRMYAPSDCLNNNYGIYVASDEDPLVAKKKALGHCYAGSSDVTSRVMHAKRGVAVHYRCIDRNLQEVEDE